MGANLKSGDIEEFKSLVAAGNGFAQTNLYYIVLPRLGNDKRDVYQHAVMCSSVQLPSRQLNTIQREIGISKRDVVYGYAHDTVSMTFRILNNQNAREYFENWQQSIVTPYDDIEGHMDINYPDEYSKTVHIYQFQRGVSFPVFSKFIDKNIDIGPKFLRTFGITNFVFDIDIDIATKIAPTYHWILEKAFPVTVQNEALSDEGMQISTVTVQFSFKKWRGEKLEGPDQRGATTAGVVGAIASLFN